MTFNRKQLKLNILQPNVQAILNVDDCQLGDTPPPPSLEFEKDDVAYCARTKYPKIFTGAFGAHKNFGLKLV